MTQVASRAGAAIAEATLIRLLTWLSPAFPTGGFAYSHGLEWSIEQGDVSDEVGLGGWLGEILTGGAGWNDAILLRHAYRAADVAALAEIAALAAATAPSQERRMEALAQGAAFVMAASVWGSGLAGAREGPMPHAVAVGAVASAHGIAEDAVCAGYLHGFTANLISAAVRLVPLGQTAGLRVLATLEPTILSVAAASSLATLDDLGGACFRSDIASMRHETQHTRLFRS